MMGAMTTFGIAVGVASLICYRMTTRLPKRRAVSRSSADHSGPGGGNDTSDGGDHFICSADENSASDHSGAASDSGESDGGEGGGGDGGGGDGGGGGD